MMLIREIIEERSIKERFLDIQETYAYRPITDHLISCIKMDYEEFFKSINLEDLKYHIEVIKENGIINLIPDRMIDELAVWGLLNYNEKRILQLNKRKEII